MFQKAVQQGRSEAHGARSNERHVCARRQVGELAVSFAEAHVGGYVEGPSDARTKPAAFLNILLEEPSCLPVH